ncbi:MAG TPA: ABC transporter substrate-binding protein [Microlunatus sp.]|jgi:multiple sugar transport system substrate-binding protein|nr:ABC transporter substrate-binding protein [Microlunatus sp.]
MTFVRHARRGLIAAVALGAVFVTAACGGSSQTPSGGGGSSAAAGADFSKQGDIEYWQGKDTSQSGWLQKTIDAFNAQHPNGKVTLHELPDNADQQRQQMIQNAQIKNPKMAVLSVDVVWTSEFAANGYIVAPPEGSIDTNGYLKAAVDAATYFNKLYVVPSTSDGGLLYYRTDLLKKYGIANPPATFDEMKADCQKIQAGENNPKLACFAGQYNKYEGLTVNFAEAVNSAGGVIVGDDGKPNVNTPEATQGLSTLTSWFKDGLIPKGAITWQEEDGRRAFQAGELIFHRNWGYVYNLANKTDGSSKVAGKFGTAPLPGITVTPGVSSLGGHSFGISASAENKGTALDFVKFMTTAENQKANALATSSAPILESLYSDPDLVKQFPMYPTLLKSIQSAKPRPKVVNYGDVTLAIQDSAYSALQQQITPEQALQQLQSKLETLIK